MTRPTQAAPPPAQPSARLAGWLARWGNILPLLAAEFILWIGFGALLPILVVLYVVPFINWRAGLERLVGRRPREVRPPMKNVTPPDEATEAP